MLTPVTDRVTYRQAAEILGCHVSYVPKLIAKGQLPVHRYPGRERGYLLRADVDELREQRAEAAAAAPPPRARRRPLVDHRPNTDHDWLAVREVARLVGITQQGVLARIRRETMPATQSGGRWWIRRDLLEQNEAARLVWKTRRP